MTYSTCTQDPAKNMRLRQKGFSLIELMVAVVIGLFIVLGLSQMFISMYSTSQSQSTLSQYQTGQTQAIVALTNTVQLAGYYASTPTSATYASTALPAFTNTGDGSSFVAGAGIVGTTGTGTPEQDTLDIYYQSSGSDNIYNCQGGVTPIGTPTPIYTAVVNSFSVNASNQLVCTVSVGGAAPTTALVLANNVQSMTVLYGVDTTGATSTPADTTDAYMTATQVGAAGDWLYVRAVQITLNFCTANVITPALTSCNTTTPWVQVINLMGKS